jgi:hypothetical protein
MPDTRVRKVTIFVSSPKDVAPERGRVQAVTAKLNREYEGLIARPAHSLAEGDAQRRWKEHGHPRDRLIQPGVPLA